MAEAVGAASAIAGLVVIAAQITRLSYSIISNVKNASKKQKLYLQEVSALADVLLRSEHAASESESLDVVGDRPATIPASILSEVKKELSTIQKDLEGGISQTKWLFQEKELRKRVDQLQNFRGIFANYIASNTLTSHMAQGRRRRFTTASDCDSGYWKSPPGNRLLESTEYVEWRDDLDFEDWLPSYRWFWCHGAPGSGKSVLASIVARELLSRSGNQVLVAYYFCDFAMRKQQTTTNILRSLLRQFARQAGEKTLSSMDTIHNGVKEEPVVEDLLAMFDAAISGNYREPRAIVILDGPDELEDSWSIISILLQRKNLRAFVASRDTPRIRLQLQNARTFDVFADPNDLALYVGDRFRELEVFFPEEGLLDIASMIVKDANGLFLLAKLLIDEVLGATTIKEMKTLLRNVPSSLVEAFESGMQRIDSQPSPRRNIARKAIAWITHAQRRLSVQELTHALATDATSAEFDEENITDIRLVLQACCGFVVVVEGGGDVSMVHTSAQQYFENLAPPDIHKIIAETCIAYLCCPPFTDGPCKTHNEMLIRLHNRPFMLYAAKYWSCHSAVDDCEVRLVVVIRGLLHHRNLRLSSFQASHYRPEIAEAKLAGAAFATIPTGQTDLHVAVYWGLAMVTQDLLNAGADVDVRDSQNWTPLHWACFRSNLKIIEYLISAKADLNAKDSEGWTPLFWLAFQGNSDGVRLLLAYGADHLEKSKRGWGALMWAFAAEQEDVVKILVAHHRGLLSKQHLASVYPMNSSEMGYTTVGVVSPRKSVDDFGLYELIAEDNMDRIQLWSSSTFDMPVSNTWRTILKAEHSAEFHYKSKVCGSKSIRLAKNGAPPWKSRLLHGSLVDGSFMAFRALLEMGVDVNDGILGRTPLHSAAYREDPRFVELLVARGAELSARDYSDQTPLHRAITHGFEATIIALLDAGSDPSAVMSGMHRTIYHEFYAENTSVSCLMLACGLDPTGKRSPSGSPKDALTGDVLDESGPKAGVMPSRIISLLLSYGADVEWKDEDGLTVLHFAVVHSILDVIKELVKGGADVDAVDDTGHTALDFAVVHDRREVMEYLRSLGAKTSITANEGIAGGYNVVRRLGSKKRILERRKRHLDGQANK